MKHSPGFEFPPAQQRDLKKARTLEWITLGYLLSVTAIMYLAMGSSQAMKTAWLEDVLSLIPPITFLVASRIASWEPNDRFPYGYHRVVSIAFLASSLALFAMGLWLLMDGSMKLVMAEHPTIGGVTLAGHTFWAGWLMLPALVWSGAPAVWLGRKKLPLARSLHDKVLHTDAAMNKADWMTAAAALVGVLGVGIGWWWADAAAAIVISVSVVRDGWQNLNIAVCDLMDERPRTVDHSDTDPLPERVRQYMLNQPWVKNAQVRLREQGHVYFGAVYVVTKDDHHERLIEQLNETSDAFKDLDWRLHDINIVIVESLADQEHVK